MCTSFIEIGQVVSENQVLKVLKASKIYKNYTIYKLNAINCEMCARHTISVMWAT